MKFAVIGDIHSNIFALNDVLGDIKNRDVDFIVSTGDLVGYMPFPNEVIDKIRAHGILAIKGNHDQYISECQPLTDAMIKGMTEEEIQKNASAHFTNYLISANNRAYLKNLPERLHFDCGGMRVLVVHGSPRKIDEYLYQDRNLLEEMSVDIQEDVIVCGHTHIPFYLEVKNKHFINAGSVGKPKHGNSNSTYVVVSVLDSRVTVEHIEVTYSVDKIVKEIQENPMISDSLIPMLLQGF